jgi:hypothetical protein
MILMVTRAVTTFHTRQQRNDTQLNTELRAAENTYLQTFWVLYTCMRFFWRTLIPRHAMG